MIIKHEVHIDDVSKEQWENYAKLFTDYSVYQTWPYQEVRAETDRQSVNRVVIKDDDGQVVAMCHVRVKTVRGLGLRIGYVQWGPLLRRRNSDGYPVEALQKLRESYIGPRVDVLRLVPNIWNDKEGERVCQALVQSGFERVSHYKPYRTLILRVDDLPEQIRSRFHRNFRSNLKKAENAELELRQGTENEFCSVLKNLYLASIKRKGFKGLNFEEFTKPQDLLSPSEKMVFFVAYMDNEAVSILLISMLGDISVALLAATNEKGLFCGASFLVWYKSILALKSAGVKLFDIGGIDPVGNPSVFRFKSSMGGQEVFHIGAFEAFRNRGMKLVWRACETLYNFVKR